MMRGTRRLKTLWAWVAIGVLAWGMMACQAPLDFSIPEEASCAPPLALEQELQKDASVLGCLVVLWSGQVPENRATYPISLYKDGNFLFRREASSEAKLDEFALPKQAREQNLLFRIYVLQASQRSASFEQHTSLCKDMGTPSYNCFDPSNPGCWMSFQFAPQSAQSSHSVKAVSEGGCRVCEPEVCDGKDNNCNGDTDEYDEVAGKPCP